MLFRSKILFFFGSLIFIFILGMLGVSPVAYSLTNTPIPASPIYERIVEGDAVNTGGMSRGIAWGDYDNDGYPDLFVANSDNQRNLLLRNQQNGTFIRIEDGDLTQLESNSESGNWVDYDNDGDLDLFVTNIKDQANFLFRNDDNNGFVRIVEGEIVTETRASTGSCWIDIDHDSDLDVFITNRDKQHNSFFINAGDGTFTQVTESILVQDSGDSRACGWADIDGDTHYDLYVVNAHEPNFLYRNNGDGTFTRSTAEALVTPNEYSYGLSWADIDNDEDLDLFIANLEATNELYLNDGAGNFHKLEEHLIMTGSHPSKGNTWGDFDNDGDLDLYIANGTPGADVRNLLYLNDGQGNFTLIDNEEIVNDRYVSAGTAWADYDNDGDLDIYVASWRNNNEDNALYRNISEATSGWIKIRLIGSESNSSGIGAVIRLTTNLNGITIEQTRQNLSNTGYGSQNSQIIHFGIGDAIQVERLEIRWPSGIIDIYENLPLNTQFTVQEGETNNSTQ